MGRAGCLSRGRGSFASQVLLARDVAVSFRHAAHGPYAELHPGRCGGPLQAAVRQQRAASNGLGFVWTTGGKCCDQARHAASGVDQFQYRANESGLQAIRFQLRLEPRNFHLRAGILPLEPVAVSAHARARPRLPQEEPGELVSSVPDGSRERAGDRRLLLAARHHRGGSQRTRSVVSEDYRVFRCTARRYAGTGRRLARARAHHAAQLDREITRHPHSFCGGRPRRSAH